MNLIRKSAIGALLVAGTLTGGAVGAAITSGISAVDTPSAVSSSSTSTTAADPQDHAARDPNQGGHQANGITEELLTGTTKATVEAAAKKAVPGGTIERVENDAEGDVYEAHMTKSDGSHVTVKLDASFNVTSVETGHGR